MFEASLDCFTSPYCNQSCLGLFVHNFNSNACQGNVLKCEVQWDLWYPPDPEGVIVRSARKSQSLDTQENHLQTQSLSIKMCLGRHSSQRSPVAPGLQTHCPDARSQSLWTEPWGLQSHFWQLPPAARGLP